MLRPVGREALIFQGTVGMMSGPVPANDNGIMDFPGGAFHAEAYASCLLRRVVMNKWLLAAILAAASVFMYVSILVSMSE